MSSQLPKPSSCMDIASAHRNVANYCLVILGSAGVGKTSLVSRFLYDRVEDSYQPTVQDSYHKNIVINDFTLKLQMIDTTGKNEFPAMRKWSIMHGDAFVLVYSIDDLSSFTMLEEIYRQIVEEKGSKDCKIMIIGNKADLQDDRQVDKSSAYLTAAKWGCDYMEVSAKNDQDVCTVFHNLLMHFSLPCRISVDHLKPTPGSWDVATNRKKLNKIKSMAVIDNTATAKRLRMRNNKRKVTSQSCCIS